MVALTPLCGTGVRKYGKNFQAIAEVIGNKLEAHIRSFFINFRRRYNLDEVLAEYEAEHGTQVIPDDDEEVPAAAPAVATTDNNNTEAKEKETKVRQTCQVFTFKWTTSEDNNGQEIWSQKSQMFPFAGLVLLSCQSSCLNLSCLGVKLCGFGRC